VNTKRFTARMAAIGVAIASTAVLLDGGAASAAQIGEMTVTPATSTTTDVAPEFDTNGPCPAPATNIIVNIYGAGLPASGGVLVGNISLAAVGGNAQGGKHLAAGTTLKQIFTDNSVIHPSGQYTIQAECQNVSGGTKYGEFVGLIQFSSTTSDPLFEASYTTSVPAAVTTTTLDAIAGPVTYGTNVTLNAHVAPSGAAGTVQFKDGGVNLGAPQPVASGASSYSSSTLGAGAHSFTAEFLPTDTGVYQASTSGAQALTVNKADTSVSLATNTPSQAGNNATFTATVPAGSPAGAVQFTVDGTNSGSPVPVGGTTAVKNVSTLGAGTYVIGATFLPTDTANYNNSPTVTQSHTVTAFTGESVAQTIDVNVPTGALTISIDGPDLGYVGDSPIPVIHMGDATFESDGQWWFADGDLNNVVITDTRAGDSGWAATGKVSDFTTPAPVPLPASPLPNTFSGYNLGWTPALVEKSANQDTLHIGATVASAKVATGGSYAGTEGLGQPQELATAADDHGNGTAVVGGSLVLYIPTDVQPGLYTATLTFTVI